MNGRWSVAQIVAKDGTVFDWWRVLYPNGRTAAVVRSESAANELARSMEALRAEFDRVVECVPAELDCIVCGRHFPITVEHACAGPGSAA